MRRRPCSSPWLFLNGDKGEPQHCLVIYSTICITSEQTLFYYSNISDLSVWSFTVDDLFLSQSSSSVNKYKYNCFGFARESIDDVVGDSRVTECECETAVRNEQNLGVQSTSPSIYDQSVICSNNKFNGDAV